MAKLVYVLIFSIIALTCCANTGDESKLLKAAELAFYQIPDHKKVSESARPYMTEDLYESLCAAWDVPQWTDGEIGNEEFLACFITGNDPSDKQIVESLELTSFQNGVYTVRVKYLEYWGNTPADKLSSIILIFVNENGRILLDDFGNNTKALCKKFIMNEVDDYLSGKTDKYMKDNQEGQWYNDRHISEVHRSFESYLVKYKSLIKQLVQGDVSRIVQ